MVNAQEWLDKNYPKEERSEIKEIYLNEPGLEGELDLGDFNYWDDCYEHGLKVCISSQMDETKLKLKNQPKKVKIIRLVNAQKYLNQQYPKVGIWKYFVKNREKETKLNVYCRHLEGTLNLSDFSDLKELDYRGNELTSLSLSNCLQLEKIVCWGNLLTNLTLTNDLTNLKHLDLSSNNFSAEQNLSFLVGATSLEYLYLGNWDKQKISRGIYNRFTGSLDYLNEMEKLRELNISNTDINEVDINKLPKSLESIEYSIELRPSCKLTTIVPQLEKYGKYGRCKKCQQPNTSKNRCQPCVDEEWKQLNGQELIKKFIQQQPLTEYGRKLQWIPYAQFTNIGDKPIGEGGFSKIYKAQWGKVWNYNVRIVVLKFLNDSQKITLEFLTEIANIKMVDDNINDNIVKCYGISQDPKTKNYMMVMEYMKEGNLRQILEQKDKKLSFGNKLRKLWNIAEGLGDIHSHGLVHRDFHSGNVLNDNYKSASIADFGLSMPANYQKKEGTLFGVLPYVAPEVLQGQPYTQKSDIYSFGVVAYELFANSYPFPDLKDLDLKICLGLRPNLEEVKIPQLLKDLIKKCWDANLEKRPNAKELWGICYNWYYEINFKENTTEFYQQYQAIEDECKHFSQSTPYKIYPTAITTSKKIDTKSITERLQKLNIFEQDHDIKDLELNLFNSEELNTQEKKIRASVFSNRQFKRQLPLDSQVENNQGESKQSKVVENLEHQTETMKMDSQEQTSLQAQIQALPKSN